MTVENPGVLHETGLGDLGHVQDLANYFVKILQEDPLKIEKNGLPRVPILAHPFIREGDKPTLNLFAKGDISFIEKLVARDPQLATPVLYELLAFGRIDDFLQLIHKIKANPESGILSGLIFEYPRFMNQLAFSFVDSRQVLPFDRLLRRIIPEIPPLTNFYESFYEMDIHLMNLLKVTKTTPFVQQKYGTTKRKPQKLLDIYVEKLSDKYGNYATLFTSGGQVKKGTCVVVDPKRDGLPCGLGFMGKWGRVRMPLPYGSELITQVTNYDANLGIAELLYLNQIYYARFR